MPQSTMTEGPKLEKLAGQSTSDKRRTRSTIEHDEPSSTKQRRKHQQEEPNKIPTTNRSKGKGKEKKRTMLPPHLQPHNHLNQGHETKP
ncbi:hypothetical protein V6N12_051771 [Hibiscus sabdariffa]|uniref:Uncharacterized protein n=1 Tax=Hibiscus sabdariffa TaxID=183260 RepID=A0ABR2GGB3_9ROSI